MPARRLLPLLLLLACSGEVEEQGDDSGAPLETTAERLARYLEGSFDSSAQASEDGRYYAVQLDACPVDLPELGAHVLYTELVYVLEPDDPFRQWLQVVAEGSGPRSAVVAVWEPLDAEELINLCADADPAELVAGDFAERQGCAETLEWDGGAYSGGTSGADCAGVRADVAHETAEVTIDVDGISRWDRGYDSDGAQVSGSELGAYRYDRLTELPPLQ